MRAINENNHTFRETSIELFDFSHDWDNAIFDKFMEQNSVHYIHKDARMLIDRIDHEKIAQKALQNYLEAAFQYARFMRKVEPAFESVHTHSGTIKEFLDAAHRHIGQDYGKVLTANFRREPA